MGSLIDIISAMMIGAVLTLVAAKVMDNGVRQFVNQNADAIVQNELATTTAIIQDDLRKVGYGIPESRQCEIIQVAEPTHVAYLSHLNSNDDVPDTLEYIITPFDTVGYIDTSVVLYSINRTVQMSDSAPVSGHVGTIANNTVFRYLDQIGNPVPVIQATRMVEVPLLSEQSNP